MFQPQLRWAFSAKGAYDSAVPNVQHHVDMFSDLAWCFWPMPVMNKSCGCCSQVRPPPFYDRFEPRSNGHS